MPRALRVNAWTPELSLEGGLADKWGVWATTGRFLRDVKKLDFEDPPALANYRHHKVGWGVVLPENEKLGEKQKATACDQPEWVQKLVDDRGGAVLRYQRDWMPKLRRYYRDHDPQDLELTGSPRGLGVGGLPLYLVILAGPDIVPWTDQYRMSAGHLVGRLDLPETALNNYIRHLMNGWTDSKCDIKTPVVWSVDWGEDDITHLMRAVLADPVVEAYKNPGNLDVLYLKDGDATQSRLIAALARNKPAMIVTTSHGKTSPIANGAALRAGAGLPLDLAKQPLDLSRLLKCWKPDGAIWYAHACCSAGTDKRTTYEGLFEAGSGMDLLLKGIAGAGNSIAPLPQALLSAERPARAFIGHVEPTFDWPLADPETGQPLSGAFCSALTERLYGKTRQPVGLCFERVQSEASQQFLHWVHAKAGISDATTSEEQEYSKEKALRAQLAALDREGTVILGDPTVTLPE